MFSHFLQLIHHLLFSGFLGFSLFSSVWFFFLFSCRLIGNRHSLSPTFQHFSTVVRRTFRLSAKVGRRYAYGPLSCINKYANSVSRKLRAENPRRKEGDAEKFRKRVEGARARVAEQTNSRGEKMGRAWRGKALHGKAQCPKPTEEIINATGRIIIPVLLFKGMSQLNKCQFPPVGCFRVGCFFELYPLPGINTT